MRRVLAGGISILLMAAIGVVSTEVASAAPKAKKYVNCKALNKDYPHGVGRMATAKDKTSGVRVTNFKVNRAVYDANPGLDRDKDKIACEKR